MKYIKVLKTETGKTLKEITEYQTRKNLFVNVTVQENRKDKSYDTIRIG